MSEQETEPLSKRLPDGWGHVEYAPHDTLNHETILKTLGIEEDDRIVVNKDELEFDRVQLTGEIMDEHPSAPNYANFGVRLLNMINEDEYKLVDYTYTHTRQEAEDLIVLWLDRQEYEYPYEKFLTDVCDLIDLYAKTDEQRDEFIHHLNEFQQEWRRTRGATGALWKSDISELDIKVNPYKKNLVQQYIDKDIKELT